MQRHFIKTNKKLLDLMEQNETWLYSAALEDGYRIEAYQTRNNVLNILDGDGRVAILQAIARGIIDHNAKTVWNAPLPHVFNNE